MLVMLAGGAQRSSVSRTGATGCVGCTLKRIACGWAVCALLLLVFAGGTVAKERLVFGVLPYKSAVELEFMFAPLAGYLSSLTGKPVLLSISKDYEEHIRRIGEGLVDVAYMGPATYVETVDRYGEQPLLARFETKRNPTYYGVIAVGKDSPIRRLAHLRGKRIAFSDQRSTSGHIVPRHMLFEAGVTLEDFSEYAFMGNQDNVALGVLVGEFDAGAIKEEVFAKYENRGLRILALTPPISEYLFIASSTLSPEMVSVLRGGLLKLMDAPGGGVIIRAMKPSASALVPVEDSDYDNLRRIIRELTEQGGAP